jgi:hypothetical protein
MKKRMRMVVGRLLFRCERSTVPSSILAWTTLGGRHWLTGPFWIGRRPPVALMASLMIDVEGDTAKLVLHFLLGDEVVHMLLCEGLVSFTF